MTTEWQPIELAPLDRTRLEIWITTRAMPKGYPQFATWDPVRGDWWSDWIGRIDGIGMKITHFRLPSLGPSPPAAGE